MKRLGTVLHVVQNKLIVRGDPVRAKDPIKLPKFNSVVVNHKRLQIGRVSEIFGPVDYPYIVVKPYRKIDASVHLGTKLYVEESRFSGRVRKDKRNRAVRERENPGADKAQAREGEKRRV